MTCEEYWERMPELQTAGLDMADASFLHLRECTACAETFERQHRLQSGLRMLRAEARGVEAPGRIEANLIEAFRTEFGGRARARQWWWIPAVSWASAAVVLIGLAVLFVPRRETPPAAHHGTQGQVQLAAADPGVDTLDAYASPEFGDGFIPLPNTEQIGPNDDVNVIRMELPRSSMMAVGLDVSADRASEPVEADVVLGSDGLPRAVRFLESSTTF